MDLDAVLREIYQIHRAERYLEARLVRPEAQTTLVAAIAGLLVIAAIFVGAPATLHTHEVWILGALAAIAAAIAGGILAGQTDVVIASHYALAVFIVAGSWTLYSTPARLVFTLLVVCQVVLFQAHGGRCPLSHIDESRVHMTCGPLFSDAKIAWVYYAMILYAMWSRRYAAAYK